MDGWQDHLHFAFIGEHVLLPNLHLDSLWKFAVASVLSVAICGSERLLTYAISKHWGPASTRRSRVRNAAWRAFLYWLVTFDRLMYMLIAMTFNVGLIVITVSTLSFGQFFIELLETPSSPTHSQGHPDSPEYKEPLLPSHSQSLSHYHDGDSDDPHGYADSYPPPVPLTLPTRRPVPTRTSSDNTHVTRTTRSGSFRSKPDGLNIYIHPSESNIARADAVARELGLSSEEDEETGIYHGDAGTTETEPLWEPGKGRDVARSLLRR
ncbi:uncharacterized protein B0H18DRAFT_878503 [Fomitopsis serialis]|uniref:uncharacterized protein n=1 Tax=Fomitopsis serialis TaxID=139415 RepID=UPI0020074B33|nr:uncharacterized protein B0H18DRAFT_878503 [Neoantrodia serialis]KAH9923620.1 hypothetical protein B0H18DRAFT_878503 [Neoantrodia serialis]